MDNLQSGAARCVFLLCSLTLSVAPTLRAADIEKPTPATMLVVGRIWTADTRRPLAEAVAVRDDKIVAVGSRDELRPYRGAKTQVIDAGPGMVVPGLIDSHIH